MTHVRMHPDELDLDDDLVRRLLCAQQPQWADLRIERIVSSGTDNAMFRLGDTMVVRLPRVERAVPRLERELAWLPVLAPQLAEAGRRGTPLATTEAQTRRSIERAVGLVDTRAVTDAWEAALRVPEWDRAPVWFHGDIARGNLLVRDGRISALIDFGSIGVGDPACDLVVAWDLFDARTRAILRAALDVDDATWDRGRGWGLCTAMWALPYYLHTNPPMVAQARRKIAEVLTDMA